jgi:hypothetical protein
MHRFIQSATGTILFRMSVDAEHYTSEKGKFEVRYQQVRSQFFATLLEAFLFYYTVDEEAELWDKTSKPVLVECKVKLFLN